MANNLPKCSISAEAARLALASAGLIVGQSQSVLTDDPGQIVTDSRNADSGCIFIAYAGVGRDGHQYIPEVLAQNPALVIGEMPAPAGLSCAYIQVRNGRAAWTWLCAEASGHPERHLRIAGVTGTNGKTSTTWMARQLAAAMGTSCVGIGTLGATTDAGTTPLGHTTPDPSVLFPYLRHTVDQGTAAVVMEMSSHAVEQKKLDPLRPAACAFTSFTRDHLDFHGTMEAYFEAKKKIFTTLLPDGATAALWSGLPVCEDLIRSRPQLRWVIYGRGARTKAASLGIPRFLEYNVASTSYLGSRLSLTTESWSEAVEVPYFADHALENLCAAIILATELTGTRPSASSFAGMKPVPGRLEQVGFSAHQPVPVVDYAHTPDALEKTLATLRKYCHGSMTVVFGCGGDRDRGKRPEMGRIAADLADRVIVTSDNPRTEDPGKIIADIVAGIPGGTTLESIADRRAAINRAISISKPGDLVVIAGKGHETYQIIGNTSSYFDDREEARRALQAWKPV